MPDIHPLAGKPVPASLLANIPRLVTAYFAEKPDSSIPSQRVAFGTSGHRGSAFNCAFNEAHILAISQALCDHRSEKISQARYSSASTPTRSPNRHSPVRWKCSRPMVLR